MIEELSELIENSVDLKTDEKFCAIIGLNPSKGARSPLLWNAVFKEKSLPIRMIPLDVNSENILKILTLLDKNKNFVAGALAVPYKETAFNFFHDRLNKTVKKIGAVNCIYRSDDGLLTAVNTDGEGAISALTSEFGDNKFKKAMILGSGGTAKAVAAFLAPDLGKVDNLTIASRNKEDGSVIAEKCGATWISWQDITSELENVDLLVNCTTVGSQSDIDNSPLSGEQIKMLPNSSTVYDVVYQPQQTKFLRFAQSYGLKNLGGLQMNLEQAVIACHKALNEEYPLDIIRKIMLTAD